jgi:hypothetical protein
LAEELVNARNDIPVNRESVLYIHDSFIKQELTVRKSASARTKMRPGDRRRRCAAGRRRQGKTVDHQ